VHEFFTSIDQPNVQPYADHSNQIDRLALLVVVYIDIRLSRRNAAVIAKQCGTSKTMIKLHYIHLTSLIAEMKCCC
jgi:hypothetical protein